MFRFSPTALLPFSSLLLLALGCGTSATLKAPAPVASFQHSIAASGQLQELSLASDRGKYQEGDAITLSLVNRSSRSYDSIAGCATPTAIWLRHSDGSTYFSNSGASSSCDSSKTIEPGDSATLATIDTGIVWVDQSSDNGLYRLPRALPAGRYTAHVLTPRGEVVTALEISHRSVF